MVSVISGLTSFKLESSGNLKVLTIKAMKIYFFEVPLIDWKDQHSSIAFEFFMCNNQFVNN